MKNRARLSDEQWALIAPHLPAPAKTDRPRADDRRTRPSLLTCDRGYDSKVFRRYLRRRGIRSCIPVRKRPKRWKPRRGRLPVADPARYAQRWKVERTFAWLLSNRRIVVRWEHHLSVYRGFVLVAMAMICLNRLLK